MNISSIDYSDLPSPFFTDDQKGPDALQPFIRLGRPIGYSKSTPSELKRFSVHVEELNEESRNSEQDSKVAVLNFDTNDLYEKGNFLYGEDGKPDYVTNALTDPEDKTEYEGPPNLAMGLPMKIQKVYFMAEKRVNKGDVTNCTSGIYEPQVDAYSAYFLCANPVKQTQLLTQGDQVDCPVSKRTHYGAVGGNVTSWKSFDMGGSHQSSLSDISNPTNNDSNYEEDFVLDGRHEPQFSFKFKK